MCSKYNRNFRGTSVESNCLGPSEVSPKARTGLTPVPNAESQIQAIIKRTLEDMSLIRFFDST